jgi:hypothetical protein
MAERPGTVALVLRFAWANRWWWMSPLLALVLLIIVLLVAGVRLVPLGYTMF